MNRRSLLKFIGAGAAGLAIGFAGGFAGGFTLAPEKVREVTVTQTGPGARTVTITETKTITAASTARLPKDTIKIGVLAIRSGTWATWGQQVEQAITLAVEEINASGGILGAKVQLVIRDELADAVKQARELVEREGVDFIIGPEASGNAMRVGSIMPELNKIMISNDAGTQRIPEELVYKQKIKHIFSLTVPVYREGILGAWIASRLPIKKWAGINPDYEYGRVCWELFTSTLKALRPDVEFVSEQWFPSPGAVDFSKYISAIMATDAEGLYATNFAVELITFHRQAAELGLYKRLKTVIYPSGYGIDAAYAIGRTYPQLPEGVWVSADYIWLYPPTEVNRRFADSYIKRWGILPPGPTEPSYTAVYFIKAAIEKAGSLDLDALIKAMEGMVIVSPAGIRWIRPEDHQSVHEVAFGKVSSDVINIGGEMPLLSEIVTLPPLLLFRSPPDYVSPLVKYKIPLTGYEYPVKVR